MSCGITVRDLKKSFRPKSRSAEIVEAVKSVSFEISHNEVFGLIGPSGCGKSTIAKVIAGLLEPDSGIVELIGRLGFVSQDPYSSLSPVMRVNAIVSEPLKFGGIKFSEQTVRDAMSRVRMDYDEFKDRLPHQLSGGQRQRVAIARALIADTGVLILDEPTSMLDYDVKHEIMDIISNLARNSNYAVLLISHDIGFVHDICTRIAVMENGLIVEEGSPEEICTNPQNELTKKLILASQDLQKYFEAHPYSANERNGH